jgi:hypothetical protein
VGAAYRSSARRAGRWLHEWVAAAPGTYIWLLILAVTALQFQQLPRVMRRVILHVDSTNLFQLTHHPVHVLVLSAVWTQASALPAFVVLFHVFHVPVERWLGTARWLAVVLLAHVGATLISEGAVWLAIHYGVDRQRMQFTLDIGVSYGLAGAAGVLAHRFPRPWNVVYGGAAVVFLAAAAALSRDFTGLGHLVALLIGLACRPLTRFRRPGGSRGGRSARVV